MLQKNRPGMARFFKFKKLCKASCQTVFLKIFFIRATSSTSMIKKIKESTAAAILAFSCCYAVGKDSKLPFIKYSTHTIKRREFGISREVTSIFFRSEER